jgi:hypothetical protein
MIKCLPRSQANRLNVVFTLFNVSLFFFLSQLIALLSGTFKYNKLYFYLFIWEELLHTKISTNHIQNIIILLELVRLYFKHCSMGERAGSPVVTRVSVAPQVLGSIPRGSEFLRI